MRAASVVLICAAIGLGSAMAQEPAPTRHTQIKLLTPWQPAGLSIGMAVTQQVSGKCFTHSLASPSRSDAWRCSAGNALMDPCYQRIMGDEKQLACPVGGPWPANVVLLTLKAPGTWEAPDLAELLRHELAHLALSDAVAGHHVPRWFDEGLAIHESGELPWARRMALADASFGRRLLPLGDLDPIALHDRMAAAGELSREAAE